MRVKEINQWDFSSLLFDTLFGLVLFFSLDSFLEITQPVHFIVYLFTTIILIHWWLLFKSADDIFDNEVTNSATDTVFGIGYIIIIEFIILYAKNFDLAKTVLFTIALLGLDLLWALTWRYVGEWRTKNRYHITVMERELSTTIRLNLMFLMLLTLLFIGIPLLSNWLIVAIYITVYLGYVYKTFKRKIIDIRFF